MCLGVPMRVRKIDGASALVEADGLERRINIGFLKGAKIGEYVIVHAGFAIEKVNEKKAREALSLYKDLKNEIPKVAFQAVEKPEDAVTVADVVVTVTPSQNPIVRDEWIRPGTHITAIGADAPGKQELDPLIFKRARIVVDRLSQCRLIGETQNPLNEGVISEADVHAELGEIVAGSKPGRQGIES